jgi:uncharacterized protein involved in type VI secretion and phage assembly
MANDEKGELHKTIWKIANDLRGSVDGWDFKQYVLGFLFYRFISENLTNYLNQHQIKAGIKGFDYAKITDKEAEFGRKETVLEKGFNYPAASGQTAAFHGLQIGTVKQLSKDPQSLNRILVMLSTNSTVKTGFWARVSNFYATNNAGLGFLPEVGDEVVVGFLEDDPRNPIILGSLYGKNKPANAAKDENNYIKQILTKAQLKINFDDQNKILTLSTPGKNTITLDDKGKSIIVADQNKNTITLNASGITISSDKDINLKAKGGINLLANKRISINASQDLVAAGLNVNLTAKSAFKAKGTGSAELSASGKTTIKGGLVNIN